MGSLTLFKAFLVPFSLVFVCRSSVPRSDFQASPVCPFSGVFLYFPFFLFAFPYYLARIFSVTPGPLFCMTFLDSPIILERPFFGLFLFAVPRYHAWIFRVLPDPFFHMFFWTLPFFCLPFLGTTLGFSGFPRTPFFHVFLCIYPSFYLPFLGTTLGFSVLPRAPFFHAFSGFSHLFGETVFWPLFVCRSSVPRLDFLGGYSRMS